MDTNRTSQCKLPARLMWLCTQLCAVLSAASIGLSAEVPAASPPNAQTVSAQPTAPNPVLNGHGNWPHWRGPFDNGNAEPGLYPVHWDATNHIAWRSLLPGKGCSTPIVWDQRILLTAPSDGQDAVLAIDWSGNRLWLEKYGPEQPGKHKNGSGCNSSPVTDGRAVFVYFKSGTLAALGLDGSRLWQTNLQPAFGKDTLFWDFGTSPVLTEQDVVIALMRRGESWLAAFDKVTGRLHWKLARKYETPVEGDHSYASPLVIRHRGREALLVWGACHLTAHDTADGRTLWDCGGFNPESVGNWPAVASPVVVGDIAVVPYARGESLHGIRLGGSGDVTATNRVWQGKGNGSFVPTPAVTQDRVCMLRDGGEFVWIAPDTGKTLGKGTLPKSANKYYASPVVADGKLYAAREDGVVFVVQAGEPFGLLAQNELGERLLASPVPVSNRLLLRGERHLFCVTGE
jgi:outer membrane protein assembly factor BamB